MILQWKKRGDDEVVYVAHWQGIDFVLAQEPIKRRFYLTANGKLVKETWPSFAVAVKDIDERQNKLIVASAKPVHLRKTRLFEAQETPIALPSVKRRALFQRPQAVNLAR